MCYVFPTSFVDGLLGPVHSVTQHIAICISRSAPAKRWSTRTVYNPRKLGRTDSHASFDTVAGLIEYTYDADGLLTQEAYYQEHTKLHTKDFAYAGGRNVSTVTLITRDGNGSRLLESWRQTPGGCLARTEWRPNDESIQFRFSVGHIFVSAPDAKSKTTIFALGKCLSELVYLATSSSIVTALATFSYDDRGRLLREDHRAVTRPLTEVDLIKKADYFNYPILSSVIVAHDGDMRTEKMNDQFGQVSTDATRMDGYGNPLTREIIRRGETSMTKYHYVHDSVGNWISRDEYTSSLSDDHVSTKTTKREIHYVK